MAPEVEFEPVIPEIAWPYLVAQKGRLDSLKDNRPAWLSAYRAATLETFGAIRPFLPAVNLNTLDVGGGMGGIDILISRAYSFDTRPLISILDGVDDSPTVVSHARPFSNAAAARAFLEANDVNMSEAISPDDTKWWSHPRFDLVVSFGAWCFHFPPSVYLPWVYEAMKPGATLIVEVRRDKPEWRDDLRRAFGMEQLAGPDAGKKFIRLAFRKATHAAG